MTLTRTLLVAAAFTLAALCLAACATEPKSSHAAQPAPLNPGALYALKADTATDKIALAVHDGGLSPAQAEALKDLAARRAKLDGGVVTVSLPHGAADPLAAAKAADYVQGVLGVQGAPSTRAAYDSDDPKAPLLVSFSYVKAEVPTCGRDWDDLTKTIDNRDFANFGCAVTANMAAQIANPSDIVHPRPEDPADAERRMTVLGKYKAGKATGSDEPDSKYSGQIAHVGQ
jgi:pilus assembly protein CpaD